jgi:hypothetical protein
MKIQSVNDEEHMTTAAAHKSAMANFDQVMSKFAG